MSRILIVEDERAIADIVAFNLNRENYETETALDGTKGLSMALEQDFDLILLDVMLSLIHILGGVMMSARPFSVTPVPT